ncbi:hypothetical protein N7474_001932 [Penicillium riverlandense]|uniref:uncharacterized protein n=1 Tax=Penicillium riverlandense TaxID=1903569 RepID=UPI0025478C2E|nr:uncharacterized protein N7474_001932 [Penicillium riverlandense]KAJ5833621.1 hypothetical protein N7474_001932 [Penicillium riverlandense]
MVISFKVTKWCHLDPTRTKPSAHNLAFESCGIAVVRAIFESIITDVRIIAEADLAAAADALDALASDAETLALDADAADESDEVKEPALLGLRVDAGPDVVVEPLEVGDELRVVVGPDTGVGGIVEGTEDVKGIEPLEPGAAVPE